ncbi:MULTISPECIES: RHS repeat-associated core domain-containing protein [unclassified Streptomyces]|uniref:RHS repeat-associated core domain-containing protein n=2 Tax=Streptomyces TaxID=1883 RepID=UPI002E123DCA|nr:YwqJ-related putative deaminase [Streptomyces sp. NBC_01205]
MTAAMSLVVPLARADTVGGYRYTGKSWQDGELPDLPVVKGHPVGQAAKSAVTRVPQGAREMRAHVPKTPKWPAARTETVTVAHPSQQVRGMGKSVESGMAPAGAPVQAGTSPVWIAPAASAATARSTTGSANAPAANSSPTTVRVETADRKRAASANVNGMLVGLTPADGVAAGGKVSVGLDYSALADAYGGGWASRLHLVALPGCALTTPDVAACRVQQPLQTANDPKNQRLTADVNLGTSAAPFKDAVLSGQQRTMAAAASSQAVAVAAVSGTAGSQGDYGATSLSASGSWAQSASGAFTYNYPVAVPPSLGGTAPSVALTYNSQSVDGKTSARNSQSSWIGDGWAYTPGFIERSYKPCKNSGIENSGDLCWAGYNATLSLGAHTGQLVRGSDGVYRLESDDGTKIERLTGATNDLWEGEYFKVTTPDGTAYYLGLNHAPGASGDTATNSAWGVPLYHPKSDDPCYSSSKGNASQCDKQVGYRFNLDFVVDPQGNVQRYDYATESNYYNMGYGQVVKDGKGGTLTQYTRSGYLTRISYGYKLADAVAGKDPAARINFGTKQRCTTSDTVCTGDNLSKDTAKNWPDVPYDINCPSSYKTEGEGDDVCRFGSPTFWSTYRLKDITTQVKIGADWQDVDAYTLTHVFSDAGGVMDPVTGKTGKTESAGMLQSVMWLSSIQHTGRDTTAGGDTPLTLDPVTFTGIEMDNRVDGLEPAAPPLYRPRISSVRTESGESSAVTYRDPECSRTKNTMPASADANTMACYPVNWFPPGAAEPVADWFVKTLVTQVVNSDLTKAGSPAKVTGYAYDGGAAWHRDDSELTDDQYRTWNDFRGYRTVTTTSGVAPDPITQTVSTYLQGMDGDYKQDGTKRSVSVTNSLGESFPDSDWLAGATLESQTFTAAGGTVTTKTLNGPLATLDTGSSTRTAWTSKDPAPASLSTLPDLVSRRSTEVTNRSMGLLSSGSWRTSKKVTTYDSLGRVHQVDDKGDVTAPEQENCTTTDYASAPADNPMMLMHPSEILSVSGPCSTKPGKDTTLSHKRIFYDGDGSVTSPGTYGKLGQAWASDGKTHSVGQVTAVQVVTKYDGAGNPVFQTNGGVVYDDYGRVTKQIDVASQVTTTAFSPASGTLPTQVTTTYPQPYNWTTTTDVSPTRGLNKRSVDINGRVTSSTYDTLGRRTAVWTPGRDRATQTPDRKFAYSVNGAGDSPNPSAVTTETLREDGSYGKSVTLYDGLLRVRQQQSTTADNSAGRLISSTSYDSHGWTASSIATYADPTTAPGTTLWVETENTVPNQTRQVYDGQGRVTAAQQWSKGAKLWEATTSYPGVDKTISTPPKGGQAAASYTNAIGQTTATQTLDTTADRKLTAGTVIQSGTTFSSKSVRLDMQADGNLVLTGIANGKALWSSGTAGNPGASATVRADGNLVVTGTTGTVLWTSGTGTAGATGGFAIVKGDGNFRMYNAAGTAIWSSGTAGKAAAADTKTSYTYTPAGEVKSISDTVGNKWTYTYDLLGQKTSQTDPDTGLSTFGYDVFGRQVLSTDALGKSVSTTYDSLGRKTGEYEGTSTTDQSKKLAEWTYDTLLKGRQTSSTRFVGGVGGKAYTKKINGYNTAYQPTGSTMVIPATEGKLAGTYTASAEYTPTVGLLQSTTFGADSGLPAETVGYGYNLQGLETEFGSRTTPYLNKTIYTPLGQVVQSTYGVYGKQFRTAQTYDQATSRLATNTVSLQTSSNSPIDATTYAYDEAGNLTGTSTVQSSGGAVTGTDTQCFLYDGQNRLAQAWTDTKGLAAAKPGQISKCNTAQPTAATIGGPNPYWQNYTYNLLGDRTQQVKHDTSGNPLKNVTQNITYPGNGTTPAAQPNTATTITTTGPDGTTTLTPHYDAVGNTTSRDTKVGAAAATTQTFTYNAKGRTDTVVTPKPVGGTQTSNYLYDADGELLIQRGPDGDTLYLFGGAEQLTLNKTSTTVAGLRNYKGPDGTKITRSSTGTVVYQATNPQNTSQLQVDAATLNVTRRAFDPYGAQRGPAPPSWADNRGYLGQPTDTATGLSLLGARNYDPVIGRFLTCDPVFEAGDPNQMGGYAYAGNDPINASDPSGLSIFSDAGDYLSGLIDGVSGGGNELWINPGGWALDNCVDIWNGDNEDFNDWTGWDGSDYKIPNLWGDHPTAELFGIDTTSERYQQGFWSGVIGSMLMDGVGAFKLVKGFRAAAKAAEAAEGSAAPLKKLLDDDVPTPSAKETPHENAPDTTAPSEPGAGTPKTPAGEGGASGADSSDGSGVLEEARELANKTTLDKNFSSRSRPKVAESLELSNGRVYSATSSGEQRPLHPLVQEVLDAVPTADRAAGSVHGKCGLPVCISQALDAGQNPTGGRVAAVKIRNNLTHKDQGGRVGPCDSCVALEDAFELDFTTVGGMDDLGQLGDVDGIIGLADLE